VAKRTGQIIAPITGFGKGLVLCLEPPDGGGVDAVGARDAGERLAGVKWITFVGSSCGIFMGSCGEAMSMNIARIFPGLLFSFAGTFGWNRSGADGGSSHSTVSRCAASAAHPRGI